MSPSRPSAPTWAPALAVALAEALPRLHGAAADPLVGELIAALSDALACGELDVDLGGPAPEAIQSEGWPEAHRRSLANSPLAAEPEGPLVLVGGQRLLWRLWQQQRQRVLTNLVARAQTSPTVQGPAAAANPKPAPLPSAPLGSDPLSSAPLGSAPQPAAPQKAQPQQTPAQAPAAPAGCQSRLDRRQQQAVQAVERHGLVLLEGGPGTGKTSTVAAMIAAAQATEPNLRVHLAAPTGKAAARLRSATGGQLPCTTLHRLLESRGGSYGRDRHHPLALDLLVVDEVSMVDLGLMEALLDALPSACRLVLVGDPAQLPPIAPGAVLLELQDPLWRQQIGGAAVTLTTTYRNAGAIAAVAAALRTGLGAGASGASATPAEAPHRDATAATAANANPDADAEEEEDEEDADPNAVKAASAVAAENTEAKTDEVAVAEADAAALKNANTEAVAIKNVNTKASAIRDAKTNAVATTDPYTNAGPGAGVGPSDSAAPGSDEVPGASSASPAERKTAPERSIAGVAVVSPGDAAGRSADEAADEAADDPIAPIRAQLAALGPADNLRWIEARPPRLPQDLVTALRQQQQRLAQLAEGCGPEDGDTQAALLTLRDALLVLTPVRQGPWGLEAIHRSLLGDQGRRPPLEWPAGTPVLCTRNLPELGLANGDVGVLIGSAADLAQRRIVFGSPGLEIAPVHPAQLAGAAEPALALTVHKAQGSEARQVIVLLPPGRTDQRLLYTALTRAREQALLITTPLHSKPDGRAATRAPAGSDHQAPRPGVIAQPEHSAYPT